MPRRHVLILRLYPVHDREGDDGLFVCEDPETGRHSTFRDGAELWRIVEQRLAAKDRSRPRRRGAVAGARPSRTSPKEPS